MDRFDYQQQELERERYQLTLEALDKIADAGFEDEALFLAGECGVTGYRPHVEHRRASVD